MIKAIRYVLENDVFQRYPSAHPNQEQFDFEDYMDVDTGTVPWYTFVTAEHPPSLMVDQLYPDLYERYSKLPKHNKEVPLVEEMSIIQLRRKRNGPPLMIYNYNTVSPVARACLSSYSYKERKEAMSIDDPDDPIVKMHLEEMDALRRDENYRRDITKKRFKLFSETAVFEVDQDIDYLACQYHLVQIGYRQSHPKGHLVNYPAHVYMDLVDYNDNYHKNESTIPLYENLEHKIATTRTIIEARISKRSSKDRVKSSELTFANYSKRDGELQKALLARSDYGDAPMRRNQAMVAQDRTRSESTINKMGFGGGGGGTKRRMKDVCKIMSTVNNISTSSSLKAKIVKPSYSKEKKVVALAK